MFNGYYYNYNRQPIYVRVNRPTSTPVHTRRHHHHRRPAPSSSSSSSASSSPLSSRSTPPPRREPPRQSAYHQPDTDDREDNEPREKPRERHVHFAELPPRMAYPDELQRLRDENRRLRNDHQTTSQILAGVKAERDELREERRHRQRTSTAVHNLEHDLQVQTDFLVAEKETTTRLRRERDLALVEKERERASRLRLEAEVVRVRSSQSGSRGLRSTIVELTRERNEAEEDRDVANRVAVQRRVRIELLERVVRRLEGIVAGLERRLYGR